MTSSHLPLHWTSRGKRPRPHVISASGWRWIAPGAVGVAMFVVLFWTSHPG